MRFFYAIVLLMVSFFSVAQELSGSELLDKTIYFHDPNNQWGSFEGTFQVVMETPAQAKRKSMIFLDIPKGMFALDVEKDSLTYAYRLNKDSCNILVNDKEASEKELEEFKLSCERASMYKNYYTYLYGLPMKLKDPGTLVHPKVETRRFKGKEYLVLRVDYEKEVGDDRWYFYFDPKTYAMEVYQFFHDEAKNDGEYILLEGIETINGIKMPKTRAWYYNTDGKYLGADTLAPIRS